MRTPTTSALSTPSLHDYEINRALRHVIDTSDRQLQLSGDALFTPHFDLSGIYILHSYPEIENSFCRKIENELRARGHMCSVTASPLDTYCRRVLIEQKTRIIVTPCDD